MNRVILRIKFRINIENVTTGAVRSSTFVQEDQIIQNMESSKKRGADEANLNHVAFN